MVDDDDRFLRFVTELLIGAGYDVRGTQDPLIAASLAEEYKPDLMILDLAMPGKDGVELARDLGAGANTSGIPVMFLTARPASEGMEGAKESGAVAYIEKPVPSSRLLWMIKTLLDGGGKET